MNTIADPGSAAPAAVRGPRERVIQTVAFEGLGLAIVSLPFAHLSGETAGDSLAVLATLAVVITLWGALYNTAFDHVECRLAHRVASDRPHRWRVIHAIGLEASAMVVTWPLIVALTALSWREAFVAEVALSLAYAAYGYGFHRVFDRLRPVVAAPHHGGGAPLQP
jgi:uncharacterized membrane protein